MIYFVLIFVLFIRGTQDSKLALPKICQSFFLICAIIMKIFSFGRFHFLETINENVLMVLKSEHFKGELSNSLELIKKAREKKLGGNLKCDEFSLTFSNVLFSSSSEFDSSHSNS